MKLNKEKIRLEMERYSWTQSELARRMDVQRQLVSRFLGKNAKDNGISLRTISKFAIALGVDAKDLIK